MSNRGAHHPIKLWNNTRLLREIVNGDFQDSRIDRYKGSTEAIHLSKETTVFEYFRSVGSEVY